MEELLYILKLTQIELKQYLDNYLKKNNMKTLNDDGFLYAIGDIPIMLVAHMDTVYDPPKNLTYEYLNDKLYNQDGGLGGDDRCGIYAIMQIIKKYKPYVLFTEDEEIGCIGALKAVDKIIKPNLKYIIELDRRGSVDCVFYDCVNLDFIKYIESFGFNTQKGSFSDILFLGNEWNTASVNLSIGYYHEHTKEEYVKYLEVLETIKKIDAMIKEIDKSPYFSYQSLDIPKYKKKLKR